MIGIADNGGSVAEAPQALNETQASSTAAAAAMLARPAVTSDLRAWNVLAITMKRTARLTEFLSAGFAALDGTKRCITLNQAGD